MSCQRHREWTGLIPAFLGCVGGLGVEGPNQTSTNAATLGDLISLVTGPDALSNPDPRLWEESLGMSLRNATALARASSEAVVRKL